MDVFAFAESALIQASNVNFSGLRPSAAPPDVRAKIGDEAFKTSDAPPLNGAASPLSMSTASSCNCRRLPKLPLSNSFALSPGSVRRLCDSTRFFMAS